MSRSIYAARRSRTLTSLAHGAAIVCIAFLLGAPASAEEPSGLSDPAAQLYDLANVVSSGGALGHEVADGLEKLARKNVTLKVIVADFRSSGSFEVLLTSYEVADQFKRIQEAAAQDRAEHLAWPNSHVTQELERSAIWVSGKIVDNLRSLKDSPIANPVRVVVDLGPDFADAASRIAATRRISEQDTHQLAHVILKAVVWGIVAGSLEEFGPAAVKIGGAAADFADAATTAGWHQFLAGYRNVYFHASGAAAQIEQLYLATQQLNARMGKPIASYEQFVGFDPRILGMTGRDRIATLDRQSGAAATTSTVRTTTIHSRIEETCVRGDCRRTDLTDRNSNILPPGDCAGCKPLRPPAPLPIATPANPQDPKGGVAIERIKPTVIESSNDTSRPQIDACRGATSPVCPSPK